MAFAVAIGANETEVPDFHIPSDVRVGSVCARFPSPRSARNNVPEERPKDNSTYSSLDALLSISKTILNHLMRAAIRRGVDMQTIQATVV